MKTGEYDNEWGTRTSKHVCDECGRDYELTPAVNSGGLMDCCLADDCKSYDPEHDLEILFMTDKEIAAEKPIVSLKKLRQRKEFQKTGKIDRREK